MSWRSLALVLLLLAGCARLPAGVGIPKGEQQAVSAAFLKWRAAQRECPCCLDADGTVTFKSWIRSGTLSGFMQAMEPAHLKFVALNPLGQPLLMLLTDGRDFQLVSVPEARVYEGSVRARAFEKYAPEGARPEEAFFWLTGRLPPGEFRIMRVARDEEAAGYWLELAGREPGLRHRVLFEPTRGVIVRHLVLDDEDNLLVDVRYDEFTPAAGPGRGCLWPGRMVMETRKHPGRLIITLSDRLTAPLSGSDFRLDLPPSYERIQVQ